MRTPTLLPRTIGFALAAVLVLTVACSGDTTEAEPTAGASRVDAATTGTPLASTATQTPTPTATATPLPPSDLELTVGAIRLTNIRFDPPSGVIAVGAQIRITADVESTFDGELRVFIAPIGEDPTAFNCMVSDGNQAFTLGAGQYDRWMRPVHLREGCPLPEAPIPLVGFLVNVFPLDESSPTLDGRLDADFTIDPALPPVE